MKKLKWILLFITIIMMAFFLFATCRKTKAYSDGAYYGEYFFITSTDTNNAMVVTYIPEWESSYRILGYLPLTTGDYFYIAVNIDKSNSLFDVRLVDSANGGVLTTNNYNPNYIASVDIIFAQNYRNNWPYFAMNIRVNYYKTTNNDTALINDFDDYVFDSYLYQPQTAQALNNDYSSARGLAVVPLASQNFTGANSQFLGTYNIFEFDCQDYITTLTEMRDDVYDDFVLFDYNKTIAIYQNAYILGYQTGYDDGESAGYSTGYTAGYSAGYTDGEGDGYRDGYQTGYDYGYDAGLSAGYNNGYADGLADNVAGQTEAYNAGYGQGRHDGYVEGYDRGYNLGYADGLANGMSGATPVSQTIGIVSSIFAGIGTVLSIQLFPGFPLGILILVPLFFAVLGLILWIWRRN